jgi:hypothetical protein
MAERKDRTAIDWFAVESDYLSGMKFSAIIEKHHISRGSLSKRLADGNWKVRRGERAKVIADKAMKSVMKRNVSELKDMNFKVEGAVDTASTIAVTIINRISQASEGTEILSQTLTDRLALAVQILEKCLTLKRLALGLSNPGASCNEISDEYRSFQIELARAQAEHGSQGLTETITVEIKKPESLN